MNIKLLLLPLIILSVSCKKTEEIPDFVKIGETAHMNVTQYDSVKNIGFYFTAFGVDIDNDNTNDFRIEPYSEQIISDNSYPAARIVSLDENLYLSKMDVSDTTYITVTHNTSHSGANVIISSSQKYYGEKQPDASVYQIVPQERLKEYYKGDMVSKEDLWKSSGFILANIGNEPFSTYYDGWERDTVWITYFTFYNDCHGLPRNTDVWVAFKKVTGENARLGWIEFNITRDGEDSQLSIKEMAIQK
jgi:hypothetical protein